MYSKDLNSPRRELSVCGLGIVVALLFGLFGSYLLCASTGGAIQLHALCMYNFIHLIENIRQNVENSAFPLAG